MDEEIINPKYELETVDKAIVKYQLLLKSTTDAHQKKTYSRKLSELKAYKGKILYLFEQQKQAEPEVSENQQSTNCLDTILAREEATEFSPDNEINTLYLYQQFFYREFLPIFTERKMKLDFKFSLDRDNFHHKYEETARRMTDYLEEADRIRQGEFHKEMELELKRRNIQKKRNLLLDLNKFYKQLEVFCFEILKDLNSAQLICLNGDDIINFDLVEGQRCLEGVALKKAIHQLYNFAQEVTGYLNIPDIT